MQTENNGDGNETTTESIVSENKNTTIEEADEKRSLAYTIIAGLTVSDHVWRWYLVVIFSFGYFATYILEFLDSYTVLLDTIFEILENKIDPPWFEEEGGDSSKSKSNNKDSFDENLFDYIVDNCYTARKRFFLLIIKTILTTIFMIVSFQILQRTGKFDKMKLLNETLSIVVILISRKLFLFFSQRKPAEEIDSESEALYNKFLKRKKDRYDGDFLFLCFKECITDCRAVIRQVLMGFFLLTDLRNLKQDNTDDNNLNKAASDQSGKHPNAQELTELKDIVETDETKSEIRQTEKEPLVKK
ncbi:unnamed protein product [Mytilus coruscus]|uniref:Uncharacterized protein n=1 Tax=Mytilus coruscus TaxID=42192 RepID=A0A6J8A970_MYTCO|nr:unnamed protein product [Mytilus coruscus]